MHRRPWLGAGLFAGVLVAAAACSTADPADPISGNTLGTSDVDAAVAPEAASTGPTFATDVDAIVQSRCQNCHRAGGIAPFPLVTYDDVKGMGALSKLKIQSRDMPPWGAYDDDACTMNHGFLDDLRMTQTEVDTFSAWVDSGMPEGDESKAPPPRTDFGATGLANKTDTFEIPQPYTVEPGTDDIRCFPINPNFTDDVWIGGVNVVPGDPRVVHHVIVYVDPNNEGPAKAGPDGSYPCFGGPTTSNPSILLAWAPGVTPIDYGNNQAGLKVTKGSGLVMQVHYHPSTATAVTDQTKFELRRLSSVPNQVAQVILAGNAKDAAGSNTDGLVTLLPGPDDPPSGPEFYIPSNSKGHTESMLLTMPATIEGYPVPPLKLAIVGAHMHWAGVDMKVNIDRADKALTPVDECLLGTPKYDFNWQRGYTYSGTLDQLPVVNGGDKITITCTYDNTVDNPNIAKAMVEEQVAVPPALTLGEATTDEMCLAVLVFLRAKTIIDN